ncbi:S9 family peptidase [Blastococcus sp. TF02-8]|uniref:alpha/beta hydrolase family protein n=1 Tax=Blastococcus sp. TF02-8 TaxID=2250574 RepID=UPI001411C4D0|nr:alpha/beta hydrolase [Blastococcus sp. TF02-8]
MPERSNGRLVVYAHGAGQTVDQLLAVGDRGRSDLVAGLVEAGYTVAASDAHGDAWGNDISVADYQALVALAREETATSTVFLIGESMGGLPAARLTAPGVLDDVRALAGVYPVCDVSSMLTAFGPSIQAAGGSAPQALLDELSPVDLDGSVPLIAWASDQDTLVAKVRNAAVCAQQVREGGGTAVLVDTIGEHGDASNFRLDQIQAFFDAATED